MGRLNVQSIKNTLVLGGARSGKSLFAESMVEEFGSGLYLATATISEKDDEMNARILKHQSRRGSKWETIEEPLKIVEVINREACESRPILVDCLTLWLSYILFKGMCVEVEIEKLMDLLRSRTLRGPVVFVSNEIGLGVMPDNKISRVFVDTQGALNQLLAKLANRVFLVSAGIPQILKDEI